MRLAGWAAAIPRPGSSVLVERHNGVAFGLEDLSVAVFAWLLDGDDAPCPASAAAFKLSVEEVEGLTELVVDVNVAKTGRAAFADIACCDGQGPG